MPHPGKTIRSRHAVCQQLKFQLTVTLSFASSQCSNKGTRSVSVSLKVPRQNIILACYILIQQQEIRPWIIVQKNREYLMSLHQIKFHYLHVP